MTDILMPALSPTMEDGVLAKWHVKVGDVLKSGDIIAEIETDKATMEVEAVDEGTVTEILVAEGTAGVKVNAVIARIAGEDEAAAPAPAAATPVAAPAPVAAPTPVTATPDSPLPSLNQPDGSRIKASPLARRIAQMRGVDLSGVTGSGPHGRIVKADLDGVAQGTTVPQSAPAPAPTPAAQESRAPEAPRAAAPLPYASGSYDVVPLDGMRRTIARRMTESFRDVPHFPLTVDIELDRLMALRGQVNVVAEAQGAKISVNDLIIKAAALACIQVPAANASYTPDGLLIHHDADIAVAVAIDGGLITPVIRKAQTKGLAAISSEMKTLADKARNRKLMPEDYAGGTFSISNLGMMGIKQFASIINEPQGCILSVGAGEKRPVVKNDALAIATVMTVTLTCDHRVVDGAVGSAWLKAFKTLLEEPVGLML